jgi:hypothetical protein
MKPLFILIAGLALSASVHAKLPPLSDEAKAKAAEAAAKTAHAGKVDNYLLCKSIDKTAAHYYKTAKAERKETKPPVATAPCVDPGKFVYEPAPAATTSAAAPAAPAAPSPGAAAAPATAKPAEPKKKS